MNALTLFSSRFAVSLPYWVSSLARYEFPRLQHFLLFALCHFTVQTLLIFFTADNSNWMLPGIHSLFITYLTMLCFFKPLRHGTASGVVQLCWLNAYSLILMASSAGGIDLKWFFYCQLAAILVIGLLKLVSTAQLTATKRHFSLFLLKTSLFLAPPAISLLVIDHQQLSFAYIITANSTVPPMALSLYEGFLHGVATLYVFAFLKPVITPFVKARLVEYVRQDISIQRTILENKVQNPPQSPSSSNKNHQDKSKPSAHYLDQVSILFADMENFSELMQRHPTEQVVAFLHDVFNEFDELCTEFGVAKIKTAGDQYMAAAGVPFPHSSHAYHCCLLALAMRARFSTICAKHKMNTALRIGISSGSVVAGFVGNDKRSYDLWGDAVNLAARMESSGEANKIQLSHSTYQLVWKQFDFEPVRQIPVKGFGITSCHYLKDFSNETQPGRHNLLTTILAKAT